MKRYWLILLLAVAVSIALLVVMWRQLSDVREEEPSSPGSVRENEQPSSSVASPRRNDLSLMSYEHRIVMPVKPSRKNKPAHTENVAHADVVDDEYVLRFVNAQDMRMFSEKATMAGAAVETFPRGNIVLVRLRGDGDIESILKDAPEPVEYEANTYSRVPDLGPELNPGADGGPYLGFGPYAMKWLGASGDRSSWGKGVMVAVVDTGINDRKCLAGRVDGRINLVDADSELPGEYGGHGTAVASILAGGSSEVDGVAPAVSILDVRAMSDDGIGDTFTLARGIVAAVDGGADVVNICIGTSGDSFVLRQAVDYALDKDVVLVAAAGNDGSSSVTYPAAYAGVVAVAAVDAAGRHLEFSNRGNAIDVSAPGLGVRAAWEDKDFVDFSGTSAATPFVSGAIAVLISEGSKGKDAVSTLLENTVDMGMPGKDNEFGDGVLSIGRIEEADQPEIYDMTANDIVVSTAEDGGQLVTVTAQNQGTESLSSVEMIVTIDGKTRTLAFHSVARGDTVQGTFEIDTSAASESFEVEWRTRIVGKEDRNPGNDRRKATLVSETLGE